MQMLMWNAGAAGLLFFGAIMAEKTDTPVMPQVETVSNVLLISMVVLTLVGVYFAFLAVWTYSKYRKRVHSLKYFDAMTGLPNWEKMKVEIIRQKTGALALFDVKSFTLYNEMFGHMYGDSLLMDIARGLRRVKLGQTMVCRYQADCFGIFFPGEAGEEEIREKMRTLFEELNNQESLGRLRMRFACGVGAIQAGKVQDLPALLDSANFARSEAKGSAKTEVIFFDRQARREMITRQTLTGELDDATLQGDLIVAYQPMYTLDGGRMMGAEALIRWQHPDRGLLMPDAFVPAFIENGSIEQIDQYILEKVLGQMLAWQKAGIPLLPISVNFSRGVFSNPDTPADLFALVTKTGLPPSLLNLELTESSLLGNIDSVVANMTMLRSMGFVISMDDFGAGYSSLALLRRLPLDVVKLDRSFLFGAEADGKQQQFIQDIVSMTHHLGMKILIEGVETLEQVNIAREAMCDYAQGFWFSRPLMKDEFCSLLRSADTLHPWAPQKGEQK